jgi:putative cardiolipin synthase
MGHRQANFIDLDVIGVGQVVHDLATVFDRYWNSEVVWPIETLHTRHDVTADTPLHHLRFDAAVRDADVPSQANYSTDPTGQSAVSVQLVEGRMALVGAEARVHGDPPEKAADPGLLTAPTAAMRGLLDTIGQARHSVAIVSPYFVPGDIGMGMMRRAAAHGVRTLLYTNSLGSTDEPLVYERYSRYRADMLRIGVEIHEFSPDLTRRSYSFGAFGQSTPRLHAKVAVVDREWLLVGSVNLDARSAVGNTEVGVVIHSRQLAEGMAGLLAMQQQRSSMYRLRLAEDGRTIEWTSTDDNGHTVATREEPGHDSWTRFKLWLQSLFIDERLL